MQMKNKIQDHTSFINTNHLYLHGKNGFAEISKNLTKYRSENNFRLSKKL